MTAVNRPGRNDDALPSHPGRPYSYPSERIPQRAVSAEDVTQHIGASTTTVIRNGTGTPDATTDVVAVSWSASGVYHHIRVYWRHAVGDADYDGVTHDMGARTSPFSHAKTGSGGHGYDIVASGGAGVHEIEYELVAEDVSNNPLASSGWFKAHFRTLLA